MNAMLVGKIAVVAWIAGGAAAVAADDPPRKNKKIDIPALIDMHNKARAEADLGPLSPNPKLEAAARVQAKDQAEMGKMSHIGSDDSTPAERIAEAGYRYQRAGENVAMGQTSSKEVFEGWMNSPPHKENILGEFTEIGAACYVGDDGVSYWSVTFGTPWPKFEVETAGPAMIDALNAARAEEDLPPLKSNPKLEAAAQQHAQAMADAGEFLKKDPDGEYPTARAQKSGYKAAAIAQTDAVGQDKAATAVSGWLSSEDSKKVLLGDFKDVGVGIATDKMGVPYWCVLLGKPRS